MMAIRTQVFEPILRVIKEVLERIQDSWAFARAKERNGGQSPQVQVSTLHIYICDYSQD